MVGGAGSLMDELRLARATVEMARKLRADPLDPPPARGNTAEREEQHQAAVEAAHRSLGSPSAEPPPRSCVTFAVNTGAPPSMMSIHGS